MYSRFTYSSGGADGGALGGVVDGAADGDGAGGIAADGAAAADVVLPIVRRRAAREGAPGCDS